MHKIFQSRVAAVATGALVIAGLGSTGAWAASSIGSDDIRDGGVATSDIRNGGVKKADVHGDAVGSHEVLDGTLGLMDLRPGAVSNLRGQQGEKGEKGERGEKGEPGAMSDDGETTVKDLDGKWHATNDSVSLTTDGVEFGPYADGGAAGGSVFFDGLEGEPVSSVTSLAYYARYVSAAETGGVGVPYLRIFTADVDSDADDQEQSWIFSPNTQQPDPDIAEGPFHEWVATSGTWRYNDDAGGPGPDPSFADLLALHGDEEITGIYITTGFSAGTDLAALLRWVEINGETFEFRGM